MAGARSQTFVAENVNLSLSYMRFITALVSKPGISQNAIQVVAGELSTLINEAKDYAINIVHKLAGELSVSCDNHLISAAVEKLNSMTQCFSGFP